jgi:hypothetical protein
MDEDEKKEYYWEVKDWRKKFSKEVGVDWAYVQSLQEALDEMIFDPPLNGIERALEALKKNK